MSVEPFTIAVPDEVLEDLRDRLGRARWPDEVAGAEWDYGTNVAYMRDIGAYWRERFDWRAQEQRLNELPHFRSVIDATGIHFIHQRGAGPNPLPLLVLHGWPSSFVQMLPILSLLTDPALHGGDAADSFDVIVPSLPGYGFSDRPTEPGMNVARIGELFHQLMTDELGYERYATRSSDLGAGVSGAIAVAHPDALVGMHVSGTNPFVSDVPDDVTDAEQRFVEQAGQWMQTEMAYAMEHSTKPQTLAFGLNDSPLGLAAWVLEKFRTWSDCDGDLDAAYDRDDLLTNLTIYWVTQTIGSSIRLYYESMRGGGAWGRPDVPTAMAMLPADMFPTPRSWAERFARVDRWTELPRGGHFGEWEVPDLLAADLRDFFRPLRTTGAASPFA